MFWRWYTRWGYLVSANRNRGGLRAQHTHEDFAWAEESPYCTFAYHSKFYPWPGHAFARGGNVLQRAQQKILSRHRTPFARGLFADNGPRPGEIDATPSPFCFPDEYIPCEVDTGVVRGLECCKPFPPMPPPRNKALIRQYQRTMVVTDPLVRPPFLGGVALLWAS